MKLTRKTSVLTVAKAKANRAINTYPGQRPLNKRHVEELRDKILDERFHMGLVAYVEWKGTRQLANGQHQGEGVIGANKSIPIVELTFTAEENDTAEDVARVFAQFNTDKPRTRQDIAWIYGVQYGMAEWPRKVVSLCNTALGYIENVSANGVILLSKDANALLLGKHRGACRFVHYLLCEGDTKNPKHLMRSPVIAAVISTWKKDTADAQAFWEAVRDGDMLKKVDPAFRLREWLKTVAVRSGDNAIAVNQREMYVRCIHWWNAFRGGPGKSGRYSPDNPIPKVR